MRNTRLLFVLILTAVILLVVVVFLLLFRENAGNTQQSDTPPLSEHDFSSPPQKPMEESTPVSQPDATVETDYGTDSHMEFPVLGE
jgi:hypothetical protein